LHSQSRAIGFHHNANEIYLTKAILVMKLNQVCAAPRKGSRWAIPRVLTPSIDDNRSVHRILACRSLLSTRDLIRALTCAVATLLILIVAWHLRQTGSRSFGSDGRVVVSAFHASAASALSLRRLGWWVW